MRSTNVSGGHGTRCAEHGAESLWAGLGAGQRQLFGAASLRVVSWIARGWIGIAVGAGAAIAVSRTIIRRPIGWRPVGGRSVIRPAVRRRRRGNPADGADRAANRGAECGPRSAARRSADRRTCSRADQAAADKTLGGIIRVGAGGQAQNDRDARGVDRNGSRQDLALCWYPRSRLIADRADGK